MAMYWRRYPDAIDANQAAVGKLAILGVLARLDDLNPFSVWSSHGYSDVILGGNHSSSSISGKSGMPIAASGTLGIRRSTFRGDAASDEPFGRRFRAPNTVSNRAPVR